MDGLLTNQMIKEMCGNYAYKKGEDLYRRKKVTILEYKTEDATVHANISSNDDFHVTVQSKDGAFLAKCTCPSLDSYDKSCHHIAAAMIAILKDRQDAGKGEKTDSFDTHDSEKLNGLLELFRPNKKMINSFRYSLNQRQLLHMEFICEPIAKNGAGYLFGIRIRLGGEIMLEVPHLREFLFHMKRGGTYRISSEFTFDPSLYQFEQTAEAVMEQVMKICDEELFYSNPIGKCDDGMILVPPNSWPSLYPLLLAAPSVKLVHHHEVYGRIQRGEEMLPLEFTLEGAADRFTLEVSGLDRLTVMEAYGMVLFEGWLQDASSEECRRLIEMKKLFAKEGSRQLEIPHNRLKQFIEQTLPGLKKLGKVRITKNVVDKVTPLKAKLFLDRVHDRLLAGLEFHYGNVVINPAADEEAAYVLRNGEAEENILKTMAESGFYQTESGYIMQNEELEYTFLYHTLPRLQKMVHVYAATAVRARLFKSPKPPRIRIEKKERTNWLAFEFDLEGVHESEIKDLLLALEEKRKYYPLRNGSLLSLESREFNEMIRFIHGMEIEKEQLAKEIHVPLIAGLKRLDLLENRKLVSLGTKLQGLLDDLKNPAGRQCKTPLQHVLLDYQSTGFQWLMTLSHYGFGGILADDMGLGKSLQSIALIQSFRPDIQKQKKPVLIVAPSSLVYNWLGELKKFTPDIQTLIIHGSLAERTKLFKKIDGTEVVVTSYPLLRKDIHFYRQHQFHTVFFDEAQAFKNPITQTAKAVKMLHADHRFALTGTPVENSADELWSIFDVVFPGLLPDQRTFHHLPKETIAKRIRPFILRRLKKDVLKELPEKVESLTISELLPDQKKLYAAYLAKLKQETLKHLNKETLHKNRIKILAGITRLRQICCHPALFVDRYKGSSGKFQQLIEIIAECRSAGRRMLIFSQFTGMLDIIRRELAKEGVPYFYLDGSTPAHERVELCRRFNDGEHEVFLISLKAGGTGLNLTGADTVILYDLWWNPAVEQQAADRAYRLGQKKDVQVIKLVARGTIEEKINNLQEKKKDLMKEIIQPAEKGLSFFSDEEIMDILMD